MRLAFPGHAQEILIATDQAVEESISNGGRGA